jgi:hypothetical protein
MKTELIKSKFLLPACAAVFAVGAAFATHSAPKLAPVVDDITYRNQACNADVICGEYPDQPLCSTLSLKNQSCNSVVASGRRKP